MQVGDLAMTHKGNLCMVVDVGRIYHNGRTKIEWYDIIFSSTGLLRTGYPAGWLRKHRGDK